MFKIFTKTCYILALNFIIIFLSNAERSFALSPEYQKEIFEACYFDAKSTLGKQRAKQYCICSTEMIHRKYSDEEILIIGQKSQNEQIQALGFAAKYCNKNASAPK